MKLPKKCPRKCTNCNPLSTIIADDKTSFVCVGLHHDEKKDVPEDIFRHCFKSATGTDSMFDYDRYDLISVIKVMSEAIFINELINKNEN